MSDIILQRENRILTSRKAQLELNELALCGGEPYIHRRLARHACESEMSWRGQPYAGNINNLEGIVGRRDRAYLLNYLGRISAKINEYVFGGKIERAGIDEDFEQDATRTGMSITETMKRVSECLTCGQWAWIGVDRDPLPAGTQRSIAERQSSNDRVWWTVWTSREVVDWHFDRQGNLAWCITEHLTDESDDPMREAQLLKVRTLWIPGGGMRWYFKDGEQASAKNILKQEEFTNSAEDVPFVLVGKPTDKPYWFDDAERIQSALLNLESSYFESLVSAQFPQMILPADILSSISHQLGVSAESAVQLVRGQNHPILEPTDSKGVTRYLMPDAGAMQVIPDALNRLRGELMQIVGLALSKDTRTAESALSKEWDRLDAEAVLADRATVLEEAERKAVALSMQLDTQFSEYVPTYPKEFDLTTFAEDIASISQLDAMTLPDGVRREAMKSVVRTMAKTMSISPERVEELEAEVDAFSMGPTIEEMAALAGNLRSEQDQPA